MHVMTTTAASASKMAMTPPTKRRLEIVQLHHWHVTAVALAVGLALNLATMGLPHWAVGETHHLTSSSTFRVDLAAGLWGYCRQAAVDRSDDGTAVATAAAGSHAGSGDGRRENDCYAFHTALAGHQLSVCEAYARGFIYGMDDVRGIRLPLAATDDVHRIERPPTSLDDVHIQQFLDKSCGVDGTATIVLGALTMLSAAAALVNVVWTHFHDSRPGCLAATCRAFAPVSALAALLTVIVWLHQSSDLRQNVDSAGRVSIHLGRAVSLQLVSAVSYAIAALGTWQRVRRTTRGTILKF